MKTLLCCIARNENKYIREYVEYYKMFGITNICLYDNNRDGEEDFNDVIGDYITNGFVILKDYRNKTVCQIDAYNECYKEYGNEYDWIAFLDADEFLTFTNEKYAYIYDFLSQDFLKPYDMIHVNWLIFGDCDNVYYTDESLFTRFSKHIDVNKKIAYDFPENFHIKSIIRGGLNNVIFEGNSHTIYNTDFNCCNEKGIKVDSKSPFLSYSFENLCIRHFSTKTIEEYCEKMKKGFPDQLWDGSKVQELLETRFFNTNKVTKEKIDVIKNMLDIDMSYLLPSVFNGIKNEDIKIYSLCYEKKDFHFLDDEVITPLQVGASSSGKDVCELKDNIGDNISDKNYFYIENTGTYWIWKNVKAKYKGQMQYRRPLNGVNDAMDFEDIFSKYDVITCVPFNHPENCKPTKDNPYYIPAKTVEEGYIFSNCIDDIGILEMIINVYYPEYKESYRKYIKEGENLYYSNGFIMRNDDYDRYCEFLFGCLEKYQTFVDVSTFDKLYERVKTNMELGKYPKHMRPETRTYEGIRWQTSIGGFLSERIWTLWLLHNFKEENILKLPYNKMENGMYT